jgi:hypothetical protein
VLARVPKNISAAFRGRKEGTTQNVMAAVDFDLKFTYVLAGWEGSAHDALVLADAVERDDGLSLPPGNNFNLLVIFLSLVLVVANSCNLIGKFYLVDAGYGVKPGFLPPYRKTRYHLKEYGGGNNPENYKKLFNLRHSSLRITIERAFAGYKNRWKFVYNKPFHPYNNCILVLEYGILVLEYVIYCCNMLFYSWNVSFTAGICHLLLEYVIFVAGICHLLLKYVILLLEYAIYC